MITVAIYRVGPGGREDSFDIELDSQILRTELKKAIEVKTSIPPDYQKLKLNDKDLPMSERPLMSFKGFVKIDVEHSYMDVWEKVKKSDDTLKMDTDETQNNNKAMVAKHALDLIDHLEQSKFFNCYFRLTEEMARISAEAKKYFVTVAIYRVGPGGRGDSFYIVLDPQILVTELQKAIEVETSIPPKYQKLKLDDKDLPKSERPLMSCKGFVEIDVEHSCMGTWKEVVARADNAKNTRSVKKDFAEETLNMIKRLDGIKFFDCYPNLHDEMSRISDESKEHFSGLRSTIETATKAYFPGWLKQQDLLTDKGTFRVDFESKSDGMQSGCVAKVHHDGCTDKYHIKTHDGGPTKYVSMSERPPNSREIFAYILLEDIGLGPECHFFGPPLGYGKRTVFICTKNIENLTLMGDATKYSENIERIVQEIHVASSILCLGDLHQSNCGYHDGKATIFDFKVVRAGESGYEMNTVTFQTREPAFVQAKTNGVGRNNEEKFGHNMEANERMKGGKNLVQEWNMSKCVEEAVEKHTLVHKRLKDDNGYELHDTDFIKGLWEVVVSGKRLDGSDLMDIFEGIDLLIGNHSDEELFRKFQIRPTKVADLGCGNGFLVYLLAEECIEGVGFDECSIDPNCSKSLEIFEGVDLLIGNHSDELTPWIPVLAANGSQSADTSMDLKPLKKELNTSEEFNFALQKGNERR
ncbi:putative tRNA (uracil-O(2)-)-methyltransferase [Ditylenchus destructor]|uniref:tRNA (Uracil-O(2)-)-methyltransferase n=1 Tax=Ditylenchus destructor TaxID=166010 RepID=A0AAD4MQH7_9BILA|nr:putative tRNA (uracil-O(2)-)-methyltransferase [Ditylenchus destructor]